METLIQILIIFVALQHLGFLYLEMFLWTKPKGRKIFALSKEKAEITKALAANQGLYNGFLAAGLLWSQLINNAVFAEQIATFFLACVFIAGCYGGYTVKKSIFFIQSIPSSIALLLIVLTPINV